MKVDLRYYLKPDGTLAVRGLVLTCENEHESKMVDECVGSRVNPGGLIRRTTCEVRLSDGYGEHYIWIDNPEAVQ